VDVDTVLDNLSASGSYVTIPGRLVVDAPIELAICFAVTRMVVSRGQAGSCP
jgi:hypothetical protein